MTARDLIPTQPRGWCRTNFDREPIKQVGNVAGYYFDLKPRIFTVTETAQLSETLVRIRFTSDDDFDGFHTLGPEDHVKLFFDKKKDGSPKLPRMLMGRWSPRGLTFRDYTIRWFDAQAKFIDIDFVLHDHGIAGRWAKIARAGDQLGALGPRGSMVAADAYPWYVLAADETALPAVARWVEGLRDGVPVTCYIEVDGPASHIELPSNADLTVNWLDRNGQEAGSTQMLSDAIIAHDFADLDGFVWVGGEALGIKPARRFLKERGFARDHFKVDGYWRYGTANHDHHTKDEDDD